MLLSGRSLTYIVSSLNKVGGLVMVARNRIRCTVVAVPVSVDHCLSRGALARDLVPWADPYVAQLIRNLQDEVRAQRRMHSWARRYRPMAAMAAESSRQPRFGIGEALNRLN